MKRPSGGTATAGPKSKVGKVDIQSISLPSSVSPQTSTTPGPNIPVKRIGVSARPKPGPVPVAQRSVEEKRLLIRKQLVILLHAIICRRRDLASTARGESTHQCNVPFCGLMKTVLVHLNSCKIGRNCGSTHCASSRQILIHWKYCVKSDCPVCVSLREAIPSSLLSIFPNPLCRAEVLSRIARQREQQNTQNSLDQAVPELLESEE